MHPYLLPGLPAYPVFLVAAVIVGVIVTLSQARHYELSLRRVVPLLPVLALAAIAGAKLYSLIERGGFYNPYTSTSTSLVEELVYGYRYPGGVLGLALAIVVLRGISLLPVPVATMADILAPSFGFAIGISRIGCFLTGCCSGTVSILPWAVRFPMHTKTWWLQSQDGLLASGASHSLPVHPLQLYLGALAVAVACLLLWLRRRKRFEGQLFLVMLVLHGGGKAILELWRYQQAPHLQVASALLAAAAFLALFLSLQRQSSSSRPVEGMDPVLLSQTSWKGGA